MKHLRYYIYKYGFRPKPGSVFYSPSLALWAMVKEAKPMEAFKRGMDKVIKETK